MPTIDVLPPNDPEHKLLTALQAGGHKVVKASTHGPDGDITVTVKYDGKDHETPIDDIFKANGYVRLGHGLFSNDGLKVSITVKKAPSKYACMECEDSGQWSGVPDCCTCKLGPGPDWQKKAAATARLTTGVASVKKLHHQKMGQIRLKVSAMFHNGEELEAFHKIFMENMKIHGFSAKLDGKTVGAGSMGLVYDVFLAVAEKSYNSFAGMKAAFEGYDELANLSASKTPPPGAVEVELDPNGGLMLKKDVMEMMSDDLAKQLDMSIIKDIMMEAAEVSKAKAAAVANGGMVTLIQAYIENLPPGDVVQSADGNGAVNMSVGRSHVETITISLNVPGKVLLAATTGYTKDVIRGAMITNTDGSETFFINQVHDNGEYTVLASQQFAPGYGDPVHVKGFIPKPDNNFEIGPMHQPSDYTFRAQNGKVMLTLKPDGTIVISEDAFITIQHGSAQSTATKEFAKQFWKSIEDMNPLRAEADNLRSTLQLVLTQLNALNSAKQADLMAAMQEKRVSEGESGMQRRFRKMLL